MSEENTHEYHAHFDCFSGAAGDMLLAACLDAADFLPYPLPSLEVDDNFDIAPESKQSDKLLAQISHDLENGLPELKDEFDLSVARVWRGSGRIAAKKLLVKSIYQHKSAPVPGTDQAQDHHSHAHAHSHSHSHRHHHSHEHNENHHSHEHNHSQGDSNSNKKEDAEHHLAHSSHNHSHHHSHHEGSEHAGHSHNKLRNLPQITKMLEDAPSKYIPRKVASLAIKAFTALAHAEMHTHGALSINQVHFHEVGAVDSIVDTVGTLLALHYLGVDLGSGNGQDCKITCSRLPLGEGTVWTDHGLLPVPAPATLRLLVGMPTCPGPPGVTGELVTPTAAALLRVVTGANSEAKKGQLSEYWQPREIDGRPPTMTPRAVGLGAGTKDFERHPNVLRLILGDCSTQKNACVDDSSNDEVTGTKPSDEDADGSQIDNMHGQVTQKSGSHDVIDNNTTVKDITDADTESCQLWNINTLTLLEANIDDATPELMAHAIDLLLENGAIDAWIVPIVMKKGRPAHALNCLCHCEKMNESNLLAIIFRHTTTLGVRIHRDIARASLTRRFIKVQLPYTDNSGNGKVDVKVSSFTDGEVVSLKAEFDQCKSISKEGNVPLKIVSSTAERLARQLIL